MPPDDLGCPGAETVKEIVSRGHGQLPYAMTQMSWMDLGGEDISFDRYRSQEFFNLEIKNLWPKVWQWACREEQIPNSGDYVVYDIGDYSFIIVREEGGDVRAYYNSCMHRGTKIKASGTEGNSRELRCPFHGWTWNLDGDVKNIPCRWDLPQVTEDSHRLKDVRVGLWGGFVFINMDPNAPDLEDYLAPIPDHFRNWDLSKRYIAVHVEKELSANWKTCLEAFMEAYHVLETHPQLLSTNSDINCQYDIYGDHVGRSWGASGVQSPHLTTKLSEQEILDSMLTGDDGLVQERLEVKEGETARSVMAKHLRKTLTDTYSTDLSSYSDTEILDYIQYNLFPNVILMGSFSFPVVYRVRPMEMSPDKTLFELIFLRPLPDTGERPEPAVPFRLKESESFTLAPGIDRAIGLVFDQDTSILRWNQEGVKAAAKSGASLTRYQEVRIRHMEATVDKYLSNF